MRLLLSLWDRLRQRPAAGFTDTPVDLIGGGPQEQRVRVLRARHSLNDNPAFAAQLLDDWIMFEDQRQAAMADDDCGRDKTRE